MNRFSQIFKFRLKNLHQSIHDLEAAAANKAASQNRAGSGADRSRQNGNFKLNQQPRQSSRAENKFQI